MLHCAHHNHQLILGQLGNKQFCTTNSHLANLVPTIFVGVECIDGAGVLTTNDNWLPTEGTQCGIPVIRYVCYGCLCHFYAQDRQNEIVYYVNRITV